MTQMRDRGRSKIRERKQCFIRDCAYLTDGLQAGREQRVLYLRREPDFTDWHVIRQLWQLAHFPLAFSAAIRTPNFPISSRMSRYNGPAGSFRAVSSSFAAIA